ncbi:hypothetical protein KL923_000113 [Ogataea haglerorum]|nr:hypothetical protein KL923_000113 [Ogataea haglerorum]
MRLYNESSKWKRILYRVVRQNSVLRREPKQQQDRHREQRNLPFSAKLCVCSKPFLPFWDLNPDSRSTLACELLWHRVQAHSSLSADRGARLCLQHALSGRSGDPACAAFICGTWAFPLDSRDERPGRRCTVPLAPRCHPACAKTPHATKERLMPGAEPRLTCNGPLM